jgi:hypothetical protein
MSSSSGSSGPPNKRLRQQSFLHFLRPKNSEAKHNSGDYYKIIIIIIRFPLSLRHCCFVHQITLTPLLTLLSHYLLHNFIIVLKPTSSLLPSSVCCTLCTHTLVSDWLSFHPTSIVIFIHLHIIQSALIIFNSLHCLRISLLNVKTFAGT